jgi:hypothetical protein
VSLFSLCTLFLAVISVAIFLGFQILYDIPFTFYVEACLAKEREPRNVSMANLIALRIGAFVNVASVIVDCLMIRFIRKTTVKTNVAPTEVSDISFVVQSNTISGLLIKQKNFLSNQKHFFVVKDNALSCQILAQRKQQILATCWVGAIL